MDSSIPDDGFTLTIESQDTANQITVQNSEDLQTARVLLDYHVRQALEHETSNDESEPAEIDIHPHVDINATDTDQLKNSIKQLQAEVEDTIPADEINSFQDAFSQELEKLRNRVNQLENQQAIENEEHNTKILTPDGDNKTYDTVEEAVKPDQEPEKPGQDNPLTLEQFRQHSGNERTNKIFEVIKQHAPITRVETGEHLFGHEISSTDAEYKELCNYWPDRLVEVTGTDGQANVYQPKHTDKPEEDDQPEEEDSEKKDSTNEEPKHTSKCKECGEEFHGDQDEVDDKLDQHHENKHHENKHHEDEECDCPTDKNGRKTHNESCPKVRALAEDNEDDEEAEEQEDERDWLELELTGYTKDQFNDLAIAGQTEVVIRNLVNCQPCTLDTLCNQIFLDSTKPPKDAIHQYLENFWDKIIIHSDGKYSVAPGVEYDPDEHPLYQLWRVRREGERYACQDCDETYDSSRDARNHRQEQGHLNWGFATGGALVDKWRQNSNEQQAEAA